MVTDATMQLTIPRASKSDGSLAPSTAHWSLTRERHILAGAHTMGQAQCQNYRARIYNDTDIDAAFAASLRAGCPATGGGARGRAARRVHAERVRQRVLWQPGRAAGAAALRPGAVQRRLDGRPGLELRGQPGAVQ